MASPSRLRALDHLRGLGILAVLVFSLWGWLYSSPAPALLAHGVAGQLHPGDLIFPLFAFCSGVSLWFYVCRQRARGQTLETAAGHYLRLLVLALLISATRIFLPFPDEVMFIALSGLLILPLIWPLGKPVSSFSSRIPSLALPLVYSLLILALRILLPVADPALFRQLASGYLGGWMGLFYYSLLLLAAALLACRAFPSAQFSPSSKPVLMRAAAISLALFCLLSLFDFPDRTALSLSFLALSFAAGVILLKLFIHLFDSGQRRWRLAEAVGRFSLAGWALFYAVSSIFWHLHLSDRLDPLLYPIFCILLYLALGAALLLIRPPSSPPISQTGSKTGAISGG